MKKWWRHTETFPSRFLGVCFYERIWVLFQKVHRFIVKLTGVEDNNSGKLPFMSLLVTTKYMICFFVCLFVIEHPDIECKFFFPETLGTMSSVVGNTFMYL